MAVGGEQNFDELLKRLSQVKSLPATEQPFRTQQNVVGSQLRDAAGGAFRSTPSLSDTVAQITQGNQAPTGVKGALHSVLSSAPAKVVLNGLNVIDIPRRAVISTVKEIGDALDSDPKTKFRGGDWYSQVKDPTFGWGRVRPGKGWGGRIEGFVGDVLLDPLTYLTFGAAVPIKATAKGAGAAAKVLKAGRVVTAGADDVALRGLLGTKTVAGREGRFALAEAVRKYGGNADEIKAVAARGKSAVPEDIARALGLNKSGLYMFGSRVRLPGSGRIGAYLEKGLVGTRLGIMKTSVGKKLSYLYTPRGTGFTGDLSNWRADVASGRLAQDKVNLIFSALNGAEDARALGTAARQDELRRIVGLFEEDPNFQQYAQDLHKIIEKPDSVVLSPGQQAAKAKVEGYLDDVANRITEIMRQVEPGWTFQKIDKYVPHILTDKARRVVEARLDEPWAQRLEQYLSVDVLDMKGNLQSRRIKEGMDDFLASGQRLEDGSIEGINRMFREVTGENFDLFETDMKFILGGYADTVRGAVETSTLMTRLMDDDFVRVLRESGHIDEEYLDALKRMVDEKWDVVAKNLEKAKEVRQNMQKTLRETLGSGGSVTGRLLAKEKQLMGQVDDFGTKIAQSAKVADGLVPLLEELDTVTLAQVAALEEISRLSVGGNAATTLVKEQVSAQMQRVNSLRREVEAARVALSRQQLADWQQGDKYLIDSIEDELRQIDKLMESNGALLDVLQQYGDSFGPELERIFKAFYSEGFDKIDVVDIEAVSGKFTAAQTKGLGSTDKSFNRVIGTVTNPFSTEYLAGPAGTGKRAEQGISDPWVSAVVTTEGTPEFELLDSIPDLGSGASKSERRSMGSVRTDARAMTLADAREVIVRASIAGDNPEKLADAFYFLTLRELRASGLNAGTDAAVQAEAQARFARELMEGVTERAKAWQTARKAVRDAAEQKRQFEVLTSERAQMGTVTVDGRKFYLSEEGESVISTLQNELFEAENLPSREVLRNMHREIVSDLDRIIGSGSGTVSDINKLASRLRQFFANAAIDHPDVSARNLESLNTFLASMVDESLAINMDSVGQIRQVVEAFSKKYLTSEEAISRAQLALRQAQNNPIIAQATYVSQRAALSEQAFAKSLREVGDTLLNYSVYHNARIAADYAVRLLPKEVQISDSLLRFAFAGSARQHAEYVKVFVQKHNWVSNHLKAIENERVAISGADQASWLLQRFGQKRDKAGNLVPLTEGEFLAVSQIMGNLGLIADGPAWRNLTSFRPSQQKWQNLVKYVLDLDDPGWDNMDVGAVVAAVTPEARVAGRAKVETGAGRGAQTLGARELKRPVDKAAREMQGAFKIQDERANKASNLRKSAPKALLARVDNLVKKGKMTRAEAETLKNQIKAVDGELKIAWKTYSRQLKDKTGLSPDQLNKMRRGLRNAPDDTYGLAALWANAVRTRRDGTTGSLRAIDDFFAHVFGGRDVLVMRGGKGQAVGPGESLTLESFNARSVETGQIVSRGERVAEFESAGQAKKSKIIVGGKEMTIDDLFREARQVRKTPIERMAYIATQVGLGDDQKVRNIIDDMVRLDDQIRVLRLKDAFVSDAKLTEAQQAVEQARRNLGDVVDGKKVYSAEDQKTIDRLEQAVASRSEELGPIDELRLQMKALERDFRETVDFLVVGVTPGERLPDIFKYISPRDSHLGKTRDALTRKMVALQELVFSPDAGLANIDSLRFGFDDLDTGKLSLYRVRYLRGLADDYRQALESLEAVKAKYAKAGPGKSASKAMIADFEVFEEAYGGDPAKFGQLVRWIEATQEAIKAGDELPVRPQGLVIPQRVANNLTELRRARTAVNDLVQTIEYQAAKEASGFDDFLRELSKLNLDPQYYGAVLSTNYRYDVAAERALRRDLSILAGGLGADAKGRLPDMGVHKAEEIPFDNALISRFLQGDGSIDDVEILVRGADGVDEVSNKRAVVDFVRSKKRQKFEYKVVRQRMRVGTEEIEVVTYEDLTGPIGARTKYSYRLNDVQGDELHLGGLEQGVPRLVLDQPVYARYSSARIAPVAGDVGADRHYFAMMNNNPITAIRYMDMLDDVTPRRLVVSGAGENAAQSASGLVSDDFHHLVDLNKTYVFYDIPAQGRVIGQRLSERNLPNQTAPSLNPAEIFQGDGRLIDNKRISAAFSLEQAAGSGRTNKLFGQLEKLRSQRNELRANLDAARLNNKQRQAILVDLDAVQGQIDDLEDTLRAGLPEAKNEARAVAWSLWERFKQPDVVGFLLNRSNMTADEAEELSLSAFKAYVKQLHEYKVTRTLEDGTLEELQPFIPDVGVSETARKNLSTNWNASADKGIIDRYNALNSRVNAAVKDLNVVKNGGEAADLVGRYISVLEQLRVAEKRLVDAKANVAQEMFVRTEAGALDAARANVDRIGGERKAARKEVQDARKALREAENIFVPVRPLRDAETALAAATERGVEPALIERLQRALALRSEEVRTANNVRESAVFQANERLSAAQAAVVAKDAEFAEATRAVSQASNAVESATSRQLTDMTADEFDAYVAKEIDAIRKGRTTELSVTVSEEQLAAVRGVQDELGKRRELLESMRPDLQARYATSRTLVEEAEKRYSALLDQYEKANAVLVRIQKSESRGGALPMGGKNYPPEYAAAKAAQQEALKKVRVAQKRLDDLTKQSVKLTAEVNAARSAGAETATLQLARDEAAGRLSLLQNALELMGREEGARPAWVKAVNRKDWDNEFDDVKREVEAVVRALNALPRETVGKDVDRVWATWTKYLESRANILLSKDDWAQAVQLERLGAAGVLNSDNMVWKNVTDEGFVILEGAGSAANFTNLQMRPEVAEILGNMGRIKDGPFVRQMRRWMVPYTKFFKAWALATPGFHVRNSITNGFMMIAAGGRPDFLYEAMLEYNAMHKFLKQGKTFPEYLDTIGDATRRQRVSDAYRAMSGSGVGQSEEVLFDTSSIITNNPITRTSRKAGTWVESHSRFMLAYDGIRQGYDVSSATARVRKFLFDYEDVSKLDATMRQIVPFWTWTSRNVPLTIQNVYLNPRPYQIYQSFKRNAQDDERTQALPLYMREAGAFAIPGTDMAATPELGFNRLAADVSMLSDPMRIAANVNPLLRVPTETVLANKSFFRNREFQQQPLPVEGPVGTLASLLGQPVGMGQSQGGQRYVDERLLYGLTNLVPTINQVERFVPSQEYYQQRGSTNPLLGMLGAPVREVTPEMTTSEQRRRLAEIQKLLASQPKPEGQ